MEREGGRGGEGEGGGKEEKEGRVDESEMAEPNDYRVLLLTLSGPYLKQTACTMMTGGGRLPQSGKEKETT